MEEYGIKYKDKVIRTGFSKEQAESFIKGRQGHLNSIEYKIVSRFISDWEAV